MSDSFLWRLIDHDNGAEREACYALRATEYARFYRNIPPTRFDDEFDAATLPDGQPTTSLIGVFDGAQLVGTCRLCITRRAEYPALPSEMQQLAHVPWDDLATQAGVPTASFAVGELGKYAVSTATNVRRVKWLLLTATGIVAAQRGLHAVVALMPPLVERAARHAGITFHHLPNTRLRRDDATARQTLLRYHDYFLPGLRKQGCDIDAAFLNEASPTALTQLLTNIPDGPKVWWIPPHELATASYPERTTDASA